MKVEYRGMSHINVSSLSRRTQIVPPRGSGIQEARPGRAPDNVYPDLTQCGQLAENRDCEEIRLPGFTLEQRVLKLQKDLEEAKAESRYLRANRSATPLGTPIRPRFTSTGLPRHQYLGMQEGPIGINTMKCLRRYSVFKWMG